MKNTFYRDYYRVFIPPPRRSFPNWSPSISLEMVPFWSPANTLVTIDFAQQDLVALVGAKPIISHTIKALPSKVHECDRK